MTDMRETHEVNGPVARTTQVGELSHLDLDAAMDHARQLRADHLCSMAIPLIRRWRSVAFIVRRALHPGMSDRADPAR